MPIVWCCLRRKINGILFQTQVSHPQIHHLRLCLIVLTALLVIMTNNDKKSPRHLHTHSRDHFVGHFCSMNFFFLHISVVCGGRGQSRNPGRLLSSSNSPWLMWWMCPWAAVSFGACFSQSGPAVVPLAAAAAAQAASLSYASRQPRSGLSALMFCEHWEYWFLVSRIILNRD